MTGFTDLQAYISSFHTHILVGSASSRISNFDNVSPYNYAINNPILMIDIDGLAADTSHKVVQLKQVDILANALIMQPFTGFWGKLNYYWNGGNFGGYQYNF